MGKSHYTGNTQEGERRHKYKILDALKPTWQIGIQAKDTVVKRSHKLLLAFFLVFRVLEKILPRN
jgi:hypothetical protein